MIEIDSCVTVRPSKVTYGFPHTHLSTNTQTRFLIYKAAIVWTGRLQWKSDLTSAAAPVC